MAQIELTNVIKKFDDLTVVNNVSLTVKSGEFLALVGPSGCGKSTLLRMISGLETIDGGSIVIDGVEVNKTPPKDRDIAMVFQNYALYPHMSVYDNLSFGLRMKGMKKDLIDEKVRKTADLLDINELLDRKPGQLSGGQKQRIAVGRAIVRDPKAFLFDEPLSNLDAKLRVKMRTDLLRLHKKQNATSVYVTHDQIEAMTMADRIAIINFGVLQQLDTPIMVYSHPKNLFVASFIGSPSMNFLNGSIGMKGSVPRFTSTSGGISCDLPAHMTGGIPSSSLSDLILGIRPEDILLNPSEDNLIQLSTVPIELIEHMGDISLIHLSPEPGVEWIVKAPPSPDMHDGQMVTLHLRTGKLHLFDGKTEENLYVNRSEKPQS
ncbi:MAG: sn-glycerol-3-phosphate ABC transporter ATP-binding protein UgpC [Rhodothermaceae bacterium]|nr:sn-glycerol-3-phosphate ABC transporter ATP-binding protein UgpC [Rhodothermaceae bacterium]